MLSAENGRVAEANSFYFERRPLGDIPCDVCKGPLATFPYYDCRDCGRLLCVACEGVHDARHVVAKIRSAAQHGRWREMREKDS